MSFYDNENDREQLTEQPLAPPAWRELGVLVLDGSLSMTWDLQPADASAEFLPRMTKGAAVDIAVRDLLARLKISRKKANFSIASISFNDAVSDRRDPEAVVDMAISSYDPTSNGVGGTRLASGLRAAIDIVSQFTAQHDDDLPVSAVVVVMSDGQAQDPAEAMAAATALKELPNTLVACCHFATKGERAEGVDLLRAIASRPDLFQTVFDAEQMRDFFHKSMTMAALPATAGPGTR